jgi:FAD/FMN-containing dehydrogenase
VTDALRDFGRTVRFSPRHRYTPADETELLDILDRHRAGRIRATGSLHSWSGAAVSDDVSLDLRRFDSVQPGAAAVAGGTHVATVGAGTTVARLVRALRERGGWALPALGAIRAQTIAGATATGTHGSGAPSMSDLLAWVRVCGYGPDGRAAVHEWHHGDALLAARCGLGCTGIVTAVGVRCVPEWDVEERFVARPTLEAVLAEEAAFPLQMFLMMPFAWRFLVFQRRRAPDGTPRTRSAALHRLYGRAHVDGLLHIALKLMVTRGGGDRRLARKLLAGALPHAFVRGWRVVDRYDRLLTLRHDWFTHEEMELSVPARHVHDAATDMRRIIEDFARRGDYTHHYPILVRRVLQDRTLLSVTAGEPDPWYALSLFCYEPPGRRAGFHAFAAVLARALADAYGARPHWGKHYPLDAADVERLYGADRLRRFRAACAAVDPHGVFRNDFTRRVLGM